MTALKPDERDPLVDPVRGDIVRLLDGAERHVLGRDGHRVIYAHVTQNKTMTTDCSAKAWRRWCARDVRIIERGIPDEGAK